MITKEQAIKLGQWGSQTIYMLGEFNSDGTPVRVRANGKCKIWKTRPTEYRLPIKHGLYDYGYLDQSNADQFTLDESECYLGRVVDLSKRPQRAVLWQGQGMYVLVQTTWTKKPGAMLSCSHLPEHEANMPYDLKGAA